MCMCVFHRFYLPVKPITAIDYSKLIAIVKHFLMIRAMFLWLISGPISVSPYRGGGLRQKKILQKYYSRANRAALRSNSALLKQMSSAIFPWGGKSSDKDISSIDDYSCGGLVSVGGASSRLYVGFLNSASFFA